MASFAESERLTLREVRPSDVNEVYYAWMNDPETTRYLESRFHPNSMEQLREYVESISRNSAVLFLAIIRKDNGAHIGNIKLGPIDWIHRRGEIGILIGDRASWGLGYATEAIGLLAEVAFQRLNLHRLTAGCYAENVGSVRAFEKAGFQQEGVRPSHNYLDGQFVDGILLGRTRPRHY